MSRDVVTKFSVARSRTLPLQQCATRTHLPHLHPMCATTPHHACAPITPHTHVHGSNAALADIARSPQLPTSFADPAKQRIFESLNVGALRAEWTVCDTACFIHSRHLVCVHTLCSARRVRLDDRMRTAIRYFITARCSL